MSLLNSGANCTTGAKGVTAQFGGKLHKVGGRHGHGDQFHPAGFRLRQRRQSAQRGEGFAGSKGFAPCGVRPTFNLHRAPAGSRALRGQTAFQFTLGGRNGKRKGARREKGPSLGSEKGPSLIFGRSGDAATENLLRGFDRDWGPPGPLVREGNRFLTLVRREHWIMFSMPRPGNEGRRLREFAVSGHDGIRLVSVRYDPRRA